MIVVEQKADDGEFSGVVTANTNLPTSPPEVEQLVVPPVGEVVQMSEETNVTEPALDAIAASLAAEQPDRPYVESAHAENFVDQEVTATADLHTTPPEVEHQVDPLVGDSVPHVPAIKGEEEDDTEPDLDAIAASFADDQPDLPNADAAQVESTVEQEVSRIQPNTQAIYLDCPGLGGSQLFSESAEHVLTAPEVGNRHQVYGPTLAPADKFLQSQVQIARGATVGVHTFSQLMFDIVDVEKAWAEVCPVNALKYP